MGFLTAVNVVECSASDMIGQYIGWTGPKTRKLFEKALGQVLFIDEAYRLAEGRFAQEAMDEMVATLTNEKFMGKIVVILAGYDQDMNRLMSVNTGLSSRFPETIYFPNMSPEQCLKLLDQELAKDKTSLPALHDPSSATYLKMTRLIDDLAHLPSWGNGRDIKTLTAQMVHKVYVLADSTTTMAADDKMTLTEEDAISCMTAMLKERSDRENNVSIRSQHDSCGLPHADKSNTQRPPPIATGTTTRSTPPSPPARAAAQQKRQPKGGAREPRKWQEQKKEQKGPENGKESQIRDPGVAEMVWQQLQAAKKWIEQEERKAREADSEMERKIKEAKRMAEEAAAAQRAKALEEQQVQEQAKRQELQRQREIARQRELQLQAERDRLTRELNQKRLEDQARRQKEEQIQQKLKKMGVCPMGYRWIPVGDGYRCAGGTHFVTRSQLGL